MKMRIGPGVQIKRFEIGERGDRGGGVGTSQRSESPITGNESTFTIYKGFMRNNLPHGDDSFADEERKREREKKEKERERKRDIEIKRKVEERKTVHRGAAIIATGTIHFRILIRKYEELIGYSSRNDESQPLC